MDMLERMCVLVCQTLNEVSHCFQCHFDHSQVQQCCVLSVLGHVSAHTEWLTGLEMCSLRWLAP